VVEGAICLQLPSWSSRHSFGRVPAKVRNLPNGADPGRYRERQVWVHQDAFLLPRLSARYRFSQETLAGPGPTGEKRRLQIFPLPFKTRRFDPNWSFTPREGRPALQDHRRRGVISTGYRRALFTDPAEIAPPALSQTWLKRFAAGSPTQLSEP
jgi:hypothetical protein